MQDRVPLYPGRVKLTPVSGQENTYDMVRADEPTQEGDPLSKATFLKDNTAALFGLGADAVPDDALAMLSRFPSSLCNDYVWIKKKLIIEMGDLKEVVVSQQTSSSATATVSYADSVDENGLVNPSTLSVSYDTYTSANILAGKYWGSYYTPEGNTATQHRPNSKFYQVWINAQQVTITTPIIGYVNSNDINAYPPEVDDGYLYTALGRIGDILGGQTT